MFRSRRAERIAVRWQAEGDRIRYTVSAPSEAIEIVTDPGRADSREAVRHAYGLFEG